MKNILFHKELIINRLRYLKRQSISTAISVLIVGFILMILYIFLDHVISGQNFRFRFVDTQTFKYVNSFPILNLVSTVKNTINEVLKDIFIKGFILYSILSFGVVLFSSIVGLLINILILPKKKWLNSYYSAEKEMNKIYSKKLNIISIFSIIGFGLFLIIMPKYMYNIEYFKSIFTIFMISIFLIIYSYHYIFWRKHGMANFFKNDLPPVFERLQYHFSEFLKLFIIFFYMFLCFSYLESTITDELNSSHSKIDFQINSIRIEYEKDLNKYSIENYKEIFGESKIRLVDIFDTNHKQYISAIYELPKNILDIISSIKPLFLLLCCLVFLYAVYLPMISYQIKNSKLYTLFLVTSIIIIQLLINELLPMIQYKEGAIYIILGVLLLIMVLSEFPAQFLGKVFRKTLLCENCKTNNNIYAKFCIECGASFLIDLNSASLKRLKSLPEIGEVIASKIIIERQTQAFQNLQDLQDRVSGIGLGLADRLSSLVTF